MPPTVNIMTARYVPGDAIGHYIRIQRKILRERYAVSLFADGGWGDEFLMNSHRYVATSRDLLWFHYSIYSDNFQLLKKDYPDRRVLDFHGICPPTFFEGYEPELAELTRKGEEALAHCASRFDSCVAHSDYTKRILEASGFKNVRKIPLAVKRDLIEGPEDLELSDKLKRLQYLIFVGRLVPQKNIIGALRFFKQLAQARPDILFFIVGSARFAPEYVREIQRFIEREGLSRNVCLTGPIVKAPMLKSFLKHAKFMLMLSHWETFCVPIVEAMAFGVPTIGSSKTAIPETIGGTGVICENEENGKAVNQVIPMLLEPDRYRSLSAKCLERAASFTEDAIRNPMLELADEAFEARPATFSAVSTKRL